MWRSNKIEVAALILLATMMIVMQTECCMGDYSRVARMITHKGGLGGGGPARGGERFTNVRSQANSNWRPKQFFSRRPPPPPPQQPPMEVSRRGQFAQSRALQLQSAPIPTIVLPNHNNVAAAAGDKTIITRINAPDHRFTATHGVALAKGRTKEFVFVVDRDDANYIAISSNIAVAGTQGGPDKYEIYMKYGERATRDNHDYRTQLASSESYLDGVLYSRDISIPRPATGKYYLLVEAKQSFHELLITAIMDTPPEAHGEEAAFEIRRMGMSPAK